MLYIYFLITCKYEPGIEGLGNKCIEYQLLCFIIKYKFKSGRKSSWAGLKSINIIKCF